MAGPVIAPQQQQLNKKLYRMLYFQVLVAIFAGVLVGTLFPSFGSSLKPLGDGFIKLIKMVIAPIIFLTVAIGIAGVGEMKKLGRVAVKALLYFEVVSTVSLLIGLLVVTLVKPGVGLNVDPATLDAKAVTGYATVAITQTKVDHVLNIIPESIGDAFAQNDTLQVLFLAILFGVALTSLGARGEPVLRALKYLNEIFFGVVDIIMLAAPLGAFGAMAFTIGKYGIALLLPLAKVMICVYLTCGMFVFVVLGLIARYAAGIDLWRFLRFIKEEILIVVGTSSSESVLPLMMAKLEQLGCSKSVVGLVIPSGYSFNLDGTSIYLSIAAMFVAQATNTQLSVGQELAILAVLMLTSKGAASVAGGGFVTLAATLSSMGTIPVAGIALLLGIDRFMSGARSLTNLIGNGVATMVVGQWEGEFDTTMAGNVLNLIESAVPTRAHFPHDHDGVATALSDDVIQRASES